MTSLADQEDAVLGGRLLDILTGQTGTPSGLLGWRTDDHIRALRVKYHGLLEREAGCLARADDVSAAISSFIEATWSILAEGQSSKPYSESRNIPTMLAALVHPTRAYGINTDPVIRLARALTGEPILGSNPMTSEEYTGVLALVEAIWGVMANEWRWRPRDLWDIQGFVWAVHRPDLVQQNDNAEEPRAMTRRLRPPASFSMAHPAQERPTPQRGRP